METNETYSDSFRDHIPSADDHNKRKWIYPKKPSGKFHRYRVIVTTALLAILFGLPFIQYKGEPFFLLNVFQRKFIIFGGVFWPQDTVLLIFVLLIFFVFVILFTAIFGRVWCGWACPQTLFMEMVFRKIEYLIEGDANQQRKLNEGPWDFTRIWKKGLKHGIFILVSLLISHTVMAYLVGVKETWKIITSSPSENMAGFIGLMVFTLLFYLVFSVVREVVCTVICPYGRLQSVLISRETVVVAYDNVRGEPRGKIKKGEDQTKKGDCIDCKLCVHVCPTGIDIRNGTQLECVNCTACIDACDEVMVKVNKPTGLIRFDSLNGIEGGKKFKLNGRVIGYSVVLLVLVAAFFTLILTRSDIETSLVRAPGQLYQLNDNGMVTNLYNLQVVNKTFKDRTLEFHILNTEKGYIQYITPGAFVVPGQGKKDAVIMIGMPQGELKGMKTRLKVEVLEEGKKVDMINTSFLGPGGI